MFECKATLLCLKSSRRCDLRAIKLSAGIDAILLTRGGGSMEDLWCFNHREVAQAIIEFDSNRRSDWP